MIPIDISGIRSVPGARLLRGTDPQDPSQLEEEMKWYEEGASIAREGEEQLDQKIDVKLDMELDMKTSHGRAREEREACAKGDAKLVNQENKNSADIITWREYEALRNEMRREFRAQGDELRGMVQGISQKLDATNETASMRADFVWKIHVKTKELIEKKRKSNAARMNKKRKEILFKPGDMVWVYFRKDRFPKLRKSKLKPRGAGPYKVLAKINDNAYSIELLVDEFGVSNFFNLLI
ncbi:hypothetical protein QYE76_015683 [Lolium multiflorum]|uniref:Tf2-1-like SH3-like domain-containing protein n=1 Tax=Lolium multiflorum TaxID=4521 RepID=A0AAD8X704_LOLMU|nr:hypothetical protein QYE76_015683 [Lolium multiflorum]